MIGSLPVLTSGIDANPTGAGEYDSEGLTLNRSMLYC